MRKNCYFGARCGVFVLTKPSGLIHSPGQLGGTSLHFALVYPVESRVFCGYRGICRFLISFFLSTEGRRKDPEEFWSNSRVGRLTSDDEEALASQQETQMIFFIQQVQP